MLVTFWSSNKKHAKFQLWWKIGNGKIVDNFAQIKFYEQFPRSRNQKTTQRKKAQKKVPSEIENKK